MPPPFFAPVRSDAKAQLEGRSSYCSLHEIAELEVINAIASPMTQSLQVHKGCVYIACCASGSCASAGVHRSNKQLPAQFRSRLSTYYANFVLADNPLVPYSRVPARGHHGERVIFSL